MSKKHKNREVVTPEMVENLLARLQSLKEELREVNDSPLTKLGKAFVIFSQYPEIFGDVPLWKLKFLFFDEWEEYSDDE